MVPKKLKLKKHLIQILVKIAGKISKILNGLIING